MTSDVGGLRYDEWQRVLENGGLTQILGFKRIEVTGG
jgi:hypothetical protein